MHRIRLFILASLLCLFLCGCAGGAAVSSAASSGQDDPACSAPQAEAVDASAEAAALEQLPPPPVFYVLEPQPSGEKEKRCEQAVIDYSHTADGYVMVQYTDQTDRRLKVLVKGPTTTYSYNLTPGQWTVFPLSDGSGDYQIGVYKNSYDSKYATVLSVSCSVELQDEFAPFLRPNQYVNFDASSQTVAKGAELTAGVEDPLEKVAVVYDYVVQTLSYDYEKAETVKSGYLPVLDEILESQKGICFDYAAVMAAMLRSQQIPCKLVVGYADSIYHAWISVWTEENGWVDGVIFFDGHVWKRMDPTFASSGGRSDEIMNYIENGNYTVKYLY